MLDERDYPALFGTTQADWAPIGPTCAIRVPLAARTAGYRWWCPSGEWCGRAERCASRDWFIVAAILSDLRPRRLPCWPPRHPRVVGHTQACVGFGPSCQPLGSEIPTSCCGLVVLVNETAETAPASDRRCGGCGHARRGSLGDRARREKRKASLRPLVVVVPLVLVEDPRKLASTPDQHPVQALLPDRPHPPLSERVGVRRLDRGLDNLDAVGCEDVVEGTGELAITVTNEEPRRAGSRCPSLLPGASRAPLLAGPPTAHSDGR